MPHICLKQSAFIYSFYIAFFSKRVGSPNRSQRIGGCPGKGMIQHCVPGLATGGLYIKAASEGFQEAKGDAVY